VLPEVLHQHQVALEWLGLQVQQPAAIRGDLEAMRRPSPEPGDGEDPLRAELEKPDDDCLQPELR
jgi:hypothetical protein